MTRVKVPVRHQYLCELLICDRDTFAMLPRLLLQMLLILSFGSGGALCLSLTQRPFTTRASVTMRADFSGQWAMDLAASEPLGPVLRAIGLGRVAAALISRLGVRQVITQDSSECVITVQTALSSEDLQLRFDGSAVPLQGVKGGKTLTCSRWLDDERLETRQLLKRDSTLSPSDPDAETFITVRFLADGGQSLVESVSLSNAEARSNRILRRVHVLRDYRSLIR